MTGPLISLLSDFGVRDPSAAIMRGVVLGIAPTARIIDISHEVRKYAIRDGALLLWCALPYLPVGVHVAIVDPQVGTERRGVAVRCEDGRVLVGPDNGVLSLAWERAGGAVEAFDITRSPHRLEPVSATFHGRDVFVPVAAHLAAGAELREAGQPLDLGELATLELPAPIVDDDGATAHALLIDGYGNVSLDLTHEHMLELGLTLGERIEVLGPRLSSEAVVVQTFADVAPGEMLLYEDAWGAVAIAVNRGDAAKALGSTRDSEVRLKRR